MSKTTKVKSKGRPGAKYRAFNESKTLAEWVKDKRSQVKSVSVLYGRLKNGMSLKDALTTPTRKYTKAAA